MFGNKSMPWSTSAGSSSGSWNWGQSKGKSAYSPLMNRTSGLQNRYGNFTDSLFKQVMSSPYAGGAYGNGGTSSSSYSSGYPGAGDPRVMGHMQHLMGGQRRQVMDLAQQLRPSASRGFAVRGGADPYAQAQRQAMDTVARGYSDRYAQAMNWAQQDYQAGQDAWKTMAGLLPSMQSNELGAYNVGLEAAQQQNARDMELLRMQHDDWLRQLEYQRQAPERAWAEQQRQQQREDWDWEEYTRNQTRDKQGRQLIADTERERMARQIAFGPWTGTAIHPYAEIPLRNMTFLLGPNRQYGGRGPWSES